MILAHRGGTLRISLIGLLCMSTLAAQETYEVRLDSIAKAGDKAHCSVVGLHEERTESVVNGKLAKEMGKQLAAEFESLMTITEVHPDGSPKSASYDVRSCLLIRDETESSIPAGSVIVDVRKSRDDAFTVGGRPASAGTQEFLAMLLPFNDPKDPSDEEWFSPKGKVKVGDSWPVEAEALAEMFESNFGGIMPQHVEGTGRLVAITKFDGEDCLSYEADVTIADFRLPLPEGMETLTSKIVLKLRALVPKDTTSIAGEAEMKMKMFGSGRNTDAAGNEIIVNLQLERSLLTTHTKIK